LGLWFLNGLVTIVFKCADKISPGSIGVVRRQKVEISEQMVAATVPSVLGGELSDTGSRERLLWDEAFQIMKTSGIKKALDRLLNASNCAPSVREKNCYRLLMAKLCLKADRPDLAKPIIEQLQALIEELHLERWESPMWIAEVLDALYQCLTKESLRMKISAGQRHFSGRLCTTDITKAMSYKA
jgi:type VI secretion system protein ImpA